MAHKPTRILLTALGRRARPGAAFYGDSTMLGDPVTSRTVTVTDYITELPTIAAAFAAEVEDYLRNAQNGLPGEVFLGVVISCATYPRDRAPRGFKQWTEANKLFFPVKQAEACAA